MCPWLRERGTKQCSSLPHKGAPDPEGGVQATVHPLPLRAPLTQRAGYKPLSCLGPQIMEILPWRFEYSRSIHVKFIGKHEPRQMCISSPHCTETPIYVFSEMKLRGLVPNSYIHVSVRDLYIFPGSVCLFWLQKNRQNDPGNIYCKSLTDTWMWKLGDRTS
jgi:hypothetical protein